MCRARPRPDSIANAVSYAVKNQVQQQAAKGVTWMLGFKFVDRSLGLLSTLILVRLLSPADFGIVAIAMAFIAMAELLAGFGFDIALIHNQRATEAHYHTAWTCNVTLGLVIAATMGAAAGPISAFYGRDELGLVVGALALGPAIGGFENIGVVAFRKDLNFSREVLFLFSKRMTAFAVTVLLAFWLRDYMALVVGMLVSRASGVILSYLMHPFRPRPSLTGARDLFHFSKWILLNNLIIFARERTTDFVIGRQHGPTALGLFNVGNELSNLPLTELAAPINRALLPVFARLQEDLPAVRSAFINTIGLLALLAVPAAFGIAAIAPYLVPVVLGPKWLEAIPLMQILALSGGLVAFQSPVCAILIGCGRPDLVFRCHTVFVVVLLAALVALPHSLGVQAAAMSLLLAALMSTPVFFWQLAREVGVAPAAILRSVLRPMIASALMWLAVRWLLPAPVANEMLTSIGQLAAGLAIGVGGYSIALAGLWWAAGRPAGAERLLFDYLRLPRSPRT